MRRVDYGLIVRGTVLFYVAAVVVLHFLQADRSPLALPMSAYVLGRGGLLMTLTFFALSAALISLALGIFARVPASLPRNAGLFFLAIGAAATFTAGLYPIDNITPPALPTTVPGRRHMMAGLFAFPSFVLGPLFLTIALRRVEAWQAVWPVLAGVATGLVLAAVWFIGFAAPAGLAGLAQRILFVMLFIWLWVAGGRLSELRDSEPTAGRVRQEELAQP